MNKISNYLDSLQDNYSDYLNYVIINKQCDAHIKKDKKKKKKKPCNKHHHKPPHHHHHHNPIVGPFQPIKPKPHHCPCCDDDKKKKTEYDDKQDKILYSLRTEVVKVKEVLEKISGQPVDIDINKIVNAVIKKQKPHEDEQSSNIQLNKDDINDLNSITIWDKDTTF